MSTLLIFFSILFPIFIRKEGVCWRKILNHAPFEKKSTENWRNEDDITIYQNDVIVRFFDAFEFLFLDLNSDLIFLSIS